MRKIKFRGKRTKHSDPLERWIIGSYVQYKDYQDNERNAIVANNGNHNDVHKDTVGQFTGLLAEKYKKNLEPEIYEDDIFRHTKETDNGDITAYLVVMWIEQLAAFYLVPIEHYNVIKGNDVSKEKGFSWLFEEAELRDFSLDVGLMKIGNIHDTPSLLTNK